MRKFLSRTLLALCTGLIFSAMLIGCHSRPAKKLSSTGIDSLARISDPSARIIALDNALKIQPGNARMLYLESKAYDETGNLDKALEYAKTAIEKDTTQTDWYFYMADLFMKKPLVKNALSIMERLAQSQPNNKMAWVKIGELYLKAGDNEKSMINLDKALKIDPNIPEAWFWRGYNYREKNVPDRAIPNFQHAIELKPDYADAYVILGLLYQARKDPKAEEYFTSAIRINPHDTAALYDRGKYNQDRDSFQRAIDDYRKILDLDPGKRNANYGTAYCLYKLKKYDDALGFFSKVLMTNPRDAAAHDGRSLCYRAMGEYEKATKEKSIADALYASQNQNKATDKK